MSLTLKKQETKTANQPETTEQQQTSDGKLEEVHPEKAEMHAEMKTMENHCAEIIEYSSISQIYEKITTEIAATKATLGEYLRQLDYIRRAAVEASDKKREQTYVNGFEIVVNAMPLNELAAMESVVRSHSQRLATLKNTKESLYQIYQLHNIEGIKYLVLEKEGIPEQIIVKK